MNARWVHFAQWPIRGLRRVRARLLPWREMWEAPPPDSTAFRHRVEMAERNLGLIIKAAVAMFLLYALFLTNWLESDVQPRADAVSVLRQFFLFYAAANVGAGFLLWGMDELSPRNLERLVYTVGILDAALLALLVTVTGGYDSIVYWLFLGLIVRNAFLIPHADVQLMVNAIVSGAYLAGGILGDALDQQEYELTQSIGRGVVERFTPEAAAEPVLLRVLLLLLMSICCYGLQILVDRQHQVEAEARELAARQAQLQAAGRLAAEIAHQLKNPLSIIHNAAWSLQRTLGEGRVPGRQIEIIQEEVRRSDRIITELMGYGRLSEGRVERVDVAEELDRAAQVAIPPGSAYDVRLHRDYAFGVPMLAAQRAHLSEVFVNLLINAREAMQGCGEIFLRTHVSADGKVCVSIRDTGPGIPSEVQEQVFEPYYTTKEKGTGLGLAIVKHNVELYGGSIRLESAPGAGTTFSIQLPVRSSLILAS